MSQPEWIELDEVDFITIDTIGPPGQRTFYLQAARDELLITVIIEKEQAAALAIATGSALDQLGEPTEEPELAGMDLIQPVEPLFRAARLELSYDQARNKFVILAEAIETEGGPEGGVRIWASRQQMSALARKAAVAVAAGRPICPLCGEPLNPGEQHVCVRDNGHKRLFQVDEGRD
jgi:uncharacterized repeat protein (TIGR03847 family)